MSDEPAITYFGMGPWPLYVGFTTSRKAFRNETSRLGMKNVKFHGGDNSMAAATTHYFTYEGARTFIITMDKPGKRSVEQVAGLIAHEAIHIAQHLWEAIGEENPGREAEAYLVQQITQCCLQEALKTGRTQKVEP